MAVYQRENADIIFFEYCNMEQALFPQKPSQGL